MSDAHSSDSDSDKGDADTAPPNRSDVDVEHRDVVDEEQREKRDEDHQADALLHGEDLHDPDIEP